MHIQDKTHYNLNRADFSEFARDGLTPTIRRTAALLTDYCDFVIGGLSEYAKLKDLNKDPLRLTISFAEKFPDHYGEFPPLSEREGAALATICDLTYKHLLTQLREKGFLLSSTSNQPIEHVDPMVPFVLVISVK